MTHNSHLLSNEVRQRLRQFSFNQRQSVSLQIKRQLQKIISIPKLIPNSISFRLSSPPKKKIIRIKSPDCRLSLPSTKSSEKTNVSFNQQQLSLISQFMNSTYKIQVNHKLENANWILEITTQLQLNRKVAYNTLYFFQEYIRKSQLNNQSKYKQISVAILWIVCKQQYQNHIGLKQCLHLLDYELTKQQFIDLQIDILKTLSFKLIPLTLYDRLIYHLNQLKHLQIYSKNKITVLDLLASQNLKEYLTACKRLDSVLLSNIHQYYSLDSIIHFLLKSIYTSHYKNRQLKNFQRAYESYWRNKYLLTQTYKMKDLNFLLSTINFNQKQQNYPKGVCHNDILGKQTYSTKLKQFGMQIFRTINFQSILY